METLEQKNKKITSKYDMKIAKLNKLKEQLPYISSGQMLYDKILSVAEVTVGTTNIVLGSVKLIEAIAQGQPTSLETTWGWVIIVGGTVVYCGCKTVQHAFATPEKIDKKVENLQKKKELKLDANTKRYIYG